MPYGIIGTINFAGGDILFVGTLLPLIGLTLLTGARPRACRFVRLS